LFLHHDYLLDHCHGARHIILGSARLRWRPDPIFSGGEGDGIGSVVVAGDKDRLFVGWLVFGYRRDGKRNRNHFLFGFAPGCATTDSKLRRPFEAGSLNAGSLNGDLEKISPDGLTAFYEITFSNANIQRLNLEGRLDDLRSGSSGFSSNMKVNGAAVNPQDNAIVDGKSTRPRHIITELQVGYRLANLSDGPSIT
jgi:hypothetical protein